MDEKNQRIVGIDQEAEIDLYALFIKYIDNLHYIIACVVIGALIFNAYAFFRIAPTYEATAKMYIVSSSSGSMVNLSDLSLGSSLTGDYQELIKSYPVLNKVVEELELQIAPQSLGGMVRVYNPENTRVLYISCTSTDPVQARDIANMVMEAAIEYLPETMSMPAPNIVQKANIPGGKTGPSYSRYTLYGALTGGLIMIGILTLLQLTDDTYHSIEEIERDYGDVVLASIPESEEFNLNDESDHNYIRLKRKSKGGKK